MSTKHYDIQELIQQLENKSSAKRRSAAKKLRKLQAVEAGPALFEALKKELEDKRTWETQYQMIMALGECGYTESLDFINDLTEHDFNATMVYVAIGDTITRLNLLMFDDINYCLSIVKNSNNSMLIDGVLRAIAMLKLKLDNNSIETVINYGQALDIENNSRTWIAAAAPSWTTDSTKAFLNECMKSENQQTKRAAEAALKNKYLKWSPL